MNILQTLAEGQGMEIDSVHGWRAVPAAFLPDFGQYTALLDPSPLAHCRSVGYTFQIWQQEVHDVSDDLIGDAAVSMVKPP